MEKSSNKTDIILSILLVVCVVGFIYFYLFQYRPLSVQSGSLQYQVTQLQNDIKNFQLQRQEPEVAAQVQRTAPASEQQIGEIYFYPGFALLDKKAKEELVGIAEEINNSPDAVIQLTGHSDNTPVGRNLNVRYPTNWTLSVERVLSTARYLQKKYDINAARFIITGKSGSQPKASNESVEGRSQNRRVDIVRLENNTRYEIECNPKKKKDNCVTVYV